ncbi:MAG: hypothetical protein HOL85_21855 [Rhodospirillaceae bacterium]|jgi:hypothetical protein|nr:hypothetical protein [Rhodospirillaceae bacterium]MBT6139388.1 hypothetical protein [Rhodospirillaceae bacterium]
MALQHSLKDKFRAWWAGRDLPPGEAEVSDPLGQFDAMLSEEPEGEPEYWDKKRLNLMQEIWGHGYLVPGGVDQTLTLTKPFAMNKDHQMMDLSPDLGGGTVAIASEFDCSIQAYQMVPDLLLPLKEHFDSSSVKGKIELVPFNPTTVEFKTRSIDCILAREFFCLVEDKVRIFEQINKAMRIYGQLTITDFVLPGNSDQVPPAVQKWIDQEEQDYYLWPKERYEEQIKALRLDLRISEDISQTFHGQILSSFQNFMSRINDGSLRGTPVQMMVLIQETERWARCAALLERGQLMVQRYFVLKSPKE